jgi:hypothetical protein
VSTELFLIIMVNLFLLSKSLTEAVLSGREAVAFRVLAVCISALYCVVRLDSDVELCFLAGNEGGIVSEQTYDRVESAQARDLDTRAARCKHCRASLATCLPS